MCQMSATPGRRMSNEVWYCSLQYSSGSEVIGWFWREKRVLHLIGYKKKSSGPYQTVLKDKNWGILP